VWGSTFEGPLSKVFFFFFDKYLFPELFTIACGKDVWMEKNMLIQNGNIHWNILFTRPVHDWEVEVASRFFELLYSQKGMEARIQFVGSHRK
jgi:hypothetical protein